MKQSAAKLGKAFSCCAKNVAVKAKFITGCLNLLTGLGSDSPRYTLIYVVGSREPSAEENDYVCKIFYQSQGKVVQALIVNGY